MTGFLKFCWMISLVVAALAWPAALALDAMATEALQITPHAPDVVELNRATETPDPKSPDYERQVAAIYGVPSRERGRFLFVPADRYIHPPELPTLTLLKVDKVNKAQNPLQVQTVRFFAQWVNLGAMAAFVLFLLAWIYRRKVARRPGPLPAELPSDRAGQKS